MSQPQKRKTCLISIKGTFELRYEQIWDLSSPYNTISSKPRLAGQTRPSGELGVCLFTRHRNSQRPLSSRRAILFRWRAMGSLACNQHLMLDWFGRGLQVSR
jgi:hypothetical protein